MKKFKHLMIIPLVSFLASCASTYPCGEPSNGKCLSVSDNYNRSYTDYTNPDDLDSAWNSASGNGSGSSKTTPLKVNFTKYSQVPADGAPLLSKPKMIRVWLTPYTDADNIFHDQSYEYVIVDRGRWNYGNNKLLSDGDVQNVMPSQVTDTKGGGFGSFGMANQPVKQPSPATPALNGFPALNGLQNQQPPVMTTTIGSGIDRTTTILP